ncbi:MAG TPA: hypothetical protein VFJ19_07905 [Nocardioidaceae bacterium]|nr:hypothetical protein [Nocardioidaceae bacterium]
MTEMIFPEAVTTQGKRNAIILSAAPADPLAPTTTELGAGVNASMFFLGQYAPTGSQNKGNSPRRLGQNGQLEVLGNKTFTAPTLSYVHDPQGDTADPANQVKGALAEDNEVWIYSRVGIDAEQAVAQGDVWRVDHLTCGHQWAVPSGDDEFAVEQITQETGYVEEPFSATGGV